MECTVICISHVFSFYSTVRQVHYVVYWASYVQFSVIKYNLSVL